ncbi:hypothetical protein Dred_3088 [Desulforamulus reducens MI-1]|uniref:DUF3307 domain-containing protein n=1 Tax=Desulforamulus reducens (strain ATCC BAA-1160 / DSM 100696 / MI-1) TaxID=349161 RepID=A4J937_DESRM|nr:DUF3307 domain-containing protein [Desulforamulus reducens]ABO51590.1 hypothetical protein Dred_3088 [Desulforamulus reducens MI-1]
MNLFEWLLMGHLVGDYLLQTRWMAENKGSQTLALVLHSLVYTGAVFVFSLPVGGIKLSGVAVIFISHLILDKRTLTNWWITNINKSPDILWLRIMNDQTFHLLVLVAVAWVTPQ